MRHYREALKNAIELGAVSSAINALVGIAEVMVERGETGRAAEILALVLQYPMLRETRDLAEALWDDLESTICPRVILDAKTRADELTLDDLACEVIEEIPE